MEMNVKILRVSNFAFCTFYYFRICLDQNVIGSKLILQSNDLQYLKKFNDYKNKTKAISYSL